MENQRHDTAYLLEAGLHPTDPTDRLGPIISGHASASWPPHCGPPPISAYFNEPQVLDDNPEPADFVICWAAADFEPSLTLPDANNGQFTDLLDDGNGQFTDLLDEGNAQFTNLLDDGNAQFTNLLDDLLGDGMPCTQTFDVDLGAVNIGAFVEGSASFSFGHGLDGGFNEGINLGEAGLDCSSVPLIPLFGQDQGNSACSPQSYLGRVSPSLCNTGSDPAGSSSFLAWPKNAHVWGYSCAASHARGATLPFRSTSRPRIRAHWH